jgi:hypothetical protein
MNLVNKTNVNSGSLHTQKSLLEQKEQKKPVSLKNRHPKSSKTSLSPIYQDKKFLITGTVVLLAGTILGSYFYKNQVFQHTKSNITPLQEPVIPLNYSFSCLSNSTFCNDLKSKFDQEEPEAVSPTPHSRHYDRFKPRYTELEKKEKPSEDFILEEFLKASQKESKKNEKDSSIKPQKSSKRQKSTKTQKGLNNKAQ